MVIIGGKTELLQLVVLQIIPRNDGSMRYNGLRDLRLETQVLIGVGQIGAREIAERKYRKE